jgi:hypothetical protein
MHSYIDRHLRFFHSWIIVKNAAMSWALLAQAYNPSYSGNRDQEDRGSKPAPEQTVHKTLGLEKTQYRNRAAE